MATTAYLSPKLQAVTGGALRPGGLSLTERAIDLCRFPRRSRVLDLGCGLGITVRHLQTDRGLNMVGLDRSFRMLSKAGKSLPDGDFVQADADAIPLVRECMDGVVGECVLSLMADPDRVLAECYRILSPGGKLVLTDLYARCPEGINGFGGMPIRSCLTGARGEAELGRMVKKAGFKLMVWEDHTPLLTQLAVDMIFSHGSMDWFWDLMGNGPRARADACRSKPGYFLMVAHKREVSNG